MKGELVRARKAVIGYNRSMHVLCSTEYLVNDLRVFPPGPGPIRHSRMVNTYHPGQNWKISREASRFPACTPYRDMNHHGLLT